ncbi:hypothetical protein PDJAM_G00041790 [Pangasius djambal]|uniref:Uncharacterized protein n=1 Tax=Pangasius djambal TaxID=1691987 RepID=A0ACC5YU45_9TELE|nr:hypothetical protein [Pangasius djambal]
MARSKNPLACGIHPSASLHPSIPPQSSIPGNVGHSSKPAVNCKRLEWGNRKSDYVPEELHDPEFNSALTPFKGTNFVPLSLPLA